MVEAARAGRFAVWAVATIDEALEVLTGLPAGKRGEDGYYPADRSTGAWRPAWTPSRRAPGSSMARDNGHAANGRSGSRRKKATAP